jgi:hypothetical protein
MEGGKKIEELLALIEQQIDLQKDMSEKIAQTENQELMNDCLDLLNVSNKIASTIFEIIKYK